MDVAFVLAVVAILAFAFTNGFHDAANAIATLVATRAGRPGPAIILAAVCNMLGPLLLGAAVTWNIVTWWKGLPSSSSHALVGGLVGATVVEAGGSAVNWGGVGGGHPRGVAGALAVLAISPVLGFGGASALERAARRACAGPPSACPGRCSGPSG